ncbi:hypothetical protein GGX14DRAFT_563407 [Mycena pura]|uniref:Uncharacterized protein n=1 Tax=Mycena pura TaxID=153505 RepID=A0AAD6YDP3_9AGAR|nr:hypothetical protein GGX14DRAFT_563407 [Mycena pura]
MTSGHKTSKSKTADKENGVDRRKGKSTPSRQPRRRDRLEDSTNTQQHGDGDPWERIRELEAALQATKARADRAEQATEQPLVEETAEKIPWPAILSAMTMEEIQDKLRIEKQVWNAIRTFIRHKLHAARLDWDKGWKAQDSTKLGLVSRAANDQFPVLKRCDRCWATSRIMKQCWDNMKDFHHDIKNPNTYLGRKARERPTPGPSHQHDSPAPSPQPRLVARRIISSEDDDFVEEDAGKNGEQPEAGSDGDNDRPLSEKARGKRAQRGGEDRPSKRART